MTLYAQHAQILLLLLMHTAESKALVCRLNGHKPPTLRVNSETCGAGLEATACVCL